MVLTLLAMPATAQQAVVAEAVESSFPVADVNADGTLSRTEFGRWLTALKARSDPSARSGSARTNAWVTSAFRLADRDGNAGVTPAELTGFFSRG